MNFTVSPRKKRDFAHISGYWDRGWRAESTSNFSASMEQYLLRVADRKPKLLTQETMNINVCKKLMENETKSAFMLSFCMLLTFRQYSFTFCFLKRQFQQWKRFQHCFKSLIQIKHRYDTMKRVRRVSYDWWSFLSV